MLYLLFSSFLIEAISVVDLKSVYGQPTTPEVEIRADLLKGTFKTAEMALFAWLRNSEKGKEAGGWRGDGCDL